MIVIEYFIYLRGSWWFTPWDRQSRHLTGVNLKKQSQFADGQISVKSYVKGDYGKFPLCGSRKNKANQSQFTRSVFCVLCTALLFCHSRGNGNPVFPVDMDSASKCGMTCLITCLIEGYLKKQSQFAVVQNWHKVIYVKRLWIISCFESTKKQSQTNPILNRKELRAKNRQKSKW